MNLEYPLNDNYHAYKHISITKTKQHKIIIMGWNSSEDQYGVLIITKVTTNEPLKPLSQILVELGPYSSNQEAKSQIEKTIGTYHEKQTTYGYGIVGFYRFLQGYYLMYIKDVENIAKVGRHKIHQIKQTEIIKLFQMRNDNTKSNQLKYLQLLNEFSLDNFYFSCTYDLTNTLAKNMVRNALPFFGSYNNLNLQPSPYTIYPDIYSICQFFQFNYPALLEFSQFTKNFKWNLSIIHGYVKHINSKLKGTIFNIIIIARRSRHHAGTRYIKRGINEHGFAANYVEIEQIVINYSSSQDTRPVCSSYVQVRGSVPTYWMQRPSIAIPKPAIDIKKDDIIYLGTRKHFHDLVSRYGRRIYCINLMKKKEKTVRQSGLSIEYQTGVYFINKEDLTEQNSIHYVEIDMKSNLKQDKKLFVSKIRTLAYFTFLKTGMFICMNNSRSSNEQFIEFQNGVIRANCVDCLDRTNSFQQLVGEIALSVQLNLLLKQDIKFQNLQLDPITLSMYNKLYEEMGDLISIQYGSSLAHKQKIQKSTQSRFELLTSIKRHLNNNWKDYDRQKQIDIFLGYKPQVDGPQIWEVETPIQHFPNSKLEILEKVKDFDPKWFEHAYNYFYESHHFKVFAKLSDNSQNLQANMEKIGKETLINKFNPDVVNSLINQKENNQVLKFCVLPKLILQKRAWRAMNPKSKVYESLQQKLSYCYNRMNFVKNQHIVTDGNPHIDVIHKKQQQPKQSKKNIKPSKTMKNIIYDDDLEFKDDLRRYLTSKDKIDNDELELIEKYLKGQMLTDQQLQSEIDAYYSLLNNQNQLNNIDFNIIEADMEFKQIQNKLNGRNYIFMENQSQTTQCKLKRQTVNIIKVNDKKQLNRDNKVQILNQTLKKNFTQGNSHKKIVQI